MQRRFTKKIGNLHDFSHGQRLNRLSQLSFEPHRKMSDLVVTYRRILDMLDISLADVMFCVRVYTKVTL